MKRLAVALSITLVAAPVYAQQQGGGQRTGALTRGLADALYLALTKATQTVTGDVTLTGNFTVTGSCTGCATGFVPTTRTISTTSPLGGGGDLSADRTFTCATCATSSNNLSFFSSTTSAQLATLLSNETGSGPAVFAISPTLTTPALGVATATSINGLILTTSTGTFTLTNAKTFAVSNTLTLAGTDSTVMTFPTTSATIARTDAANSFTGTQTFGAVVGTTWNGNTWATGTGTLSIAAGKTATFSNSVTHAGTDGTTFTTPSTSATAARTDAGQTFTGDERINGNIGVNMAPSFALDATSSSAGNDLFRLNNTTTTGGAGFLARDGNGTTSGRLAFGEFFSSETSSQDWIYGMNATKDFVVRDATASSDRITVSQSTGGVQIRGTNTNDNASAGYVGELITGTTAANTTTLSTTTTANVGTNTNISLTAGDWDCSGVVNFTYGAATSITNLAGGISTTSATLPAQDSYFDYETAANVPTATAVAAWIVPTVRVSVAPSPASPNVWLVTQGTFTVSTLKAGGTIRCRRVR